MILQKAFQENGYTDILDRADALEYGIDLEEFFDSDKKPEELLSIFISEQRDELFFLLNGDSMEINSLCDQWDDRIRVFTIMNGRSKIVQRLKYNIVQLIVYSGDKPDDSKEANLLMSRKIIIKGDLTDKNCIEIADDEAIELPFHMIPADAFAPDQERMKQLAQLLPEDGEILSIIKRPWRRMNRVVIKDKQKKSLAEQDYTKIKEWLENDHS